MPQKTSTSTTSSRIALVTGGGGTLGAAIARALLAEGHRVALADRDEAALGAVAAATSGEILPLRFDVSNGEEVKAACQAIRAKWGRVDILVNNAGILSNNKLVETTLEEWRRILAVNLDSAYLLSRECVPLMRAQRWGRIINMCSLAMKTGGLTAGTAYTTSKGGLGALTFSMARELAPHGVTVNGLAPAYVRTKMVTEQLTEAQREELLRTIPVGRFCEPEEVAFAVVFLCSPLAGFITGEILDINGGLHLD
jgi:3-oxoacyl-[acyl-carrier protein] reductase